MKNPILKENNSIPVGLLIVGAVVAGTIAYLYLTESGAEARKSIVLNVKEFAKDTAAGYVSGKTSIPKHTVRKIANHFIK